PPPVILALHTLEYLSLDFARQGVIAAIAVAMACALTLLVSGHNRRRLMRRFRPLHIFAALGLFLGLATHAIIYLHPRSNRYPDTFFHPSHLFYRHLYTDGFADGNADFNRHRLADDDRSDHGHSHTHACLHGRKYLLCGQERPRQQSRHRSVTLADH
ncbi:MAG: hypothetical protein HGA76_07700, partial [Candidatus Firestonebacteria bacterium]|nr:hypothetical protein [Candidatus Firestonebacteria bacterium]